MPFKSKSQARFMFATMPKLAKKWAKYGISNDLPEKKSPWLNMGIDQKKKKETN